MPKAKLEHLLASLKPYHAHGRKIKARIQAWENFMKTVRTEEALVVDIADQDQAIEVMRQVWQYNLANADKLSVRAVAGWQDKSEQDCPIVRFFRQKLCGPEERYNESYSANDGAKADVILRFNPKFQSLQQLEADPSIVRVSAGVQMAKLEQFLLRHHLSLPTATMINKVSVVGAATNACHGTGRDQPGINGLIKGMDVLMPDGQVKRIDPNHPDFQTLIAAPMGLTGVVLSLDIQTEPVFKLKEEAKNYCNLADLRPDLPALLNKPYFSLIMVPLYGDGIIREQLIPNIQIRTWERTESKRTQHNSPHEYDTAEDVANELATDIGGSVLDFLYRYNLFELMPAYMALAAVMITQTRGEKDRIDYANNTMHYQTAFPTQLGLSSFQMVVDPAQEAQILADALEHANQLLIAASDNNQYPVGFSIYARLFKGTQGGVSPAQCRDDQRILALEFVTNPQAPGFNQFIKDMQAWFAAHHIPARFHLGKEMPEGTNLVNMVGEAAVQQFTEALSRWHAPMDWRNNPALTPYYKQMLGQALTAEEQAVLASNPVGERPHQEPDELCLAQLRRLSQRVAKEKALTEPHRAAQRNFLDLLEQNMAALEQRLRAAAPVP